MNPQGTPLKGLTFVRVLAYSLLALSEQLRIQFSPPSPVESPLVGCSSKQPERGGDSFWSQWSDNLAYVLGFAFADAGIGRGRNSLTFSQSRPDILSKIQECVPSGRLTYSQGAKVYRLRYCFPGFNAMLRPHGIIPNKTVHGYWPTTIPSQLIRHYIRGYFDGDGSIYIRKHLHTAIAHFVCHKADFLERLRSELRRLNIGSNRVFQDGNNYRLRITKRADLYQMHSQIYSGAGLFCPFKKKKFDEAVSKIKLGRYRM